MSAVAGRLDEQPRASDPEVALFNDAFLSVLIALAATSYSEKSDNDQPMPWLLAFLVVPLVATESTRSRLPRNTRARFSTWISGEPLLHADFAERAAAFTPRVQSALRYGLRAGTLVVEGEGIRSRLRAKHYQRLGTREAVEAGHGAAFLGRWFAVVQDLPSIFRQLGVTP
jgi:hypothetical protein